MQTSVEQDRLILLGSYAIIDRTDVNAGIRHREARLQTAPTENGCVHPNKTQTPQAHTEKRGCKPRLRKPAAEAHTEKRGYKPRLRKPAASVLIN